MSGEKIAIVIPALNEEAAIAQLLTEIPRESAQWIIVVDNGSTDQTATAAKDGGALVVSEPRRGYGRACSTGADYAQKLGADILVFMDGDGSDNPADLPHMLEPVLSGMADLAIGSRVSKYAERGAVPPQARLGNWLVSRLISRFHRVSLHDVGSFRVINPAVLQKLEMREMTFGWPVEMLAKAARDGFHITEIPLRYRRRSHGRSKVGGTMVGSIKAAYYMLRTTLRYVGSRKVYG